MTGGSSSSGSSSSRSSRTSKSSSSRSAASGSSSSTSWIKVAALIIVCITITAVLVTRKGSNQLNGVSSSTDLSSSPDAASADAELKAAMAELAAFEGGAAAAAAAAAGGDPTTPSLTPASGSPSLPSDEEMLAALMASEEKPASAATSSTDSKAAEKAASEEKKATPVTPAADSTPSTPVDTSSESESTSEQSTSSTPLEAILNQPIYSNHWCVGPDSDITGKKHSHQPGRYLGAKEGQISCHYTNICFDPQARDWLYYLDPELDQLVRRIAEEEREQTHAQQPHAAEPASIPTGEPGTEGNTEASAEAMHSHADEDTVDPLAWLDPTDILLRSSARKMGSSSLWSDALKAMSGVKDTFPMSSFFKPKLIKQSVPNDPQSIYWAYNSLPALPVFPLDSLEASRNAYHAWQENWARSNQNAGGQHKLHQHVPNVPKAYVLYEPVDAANLGQTLANDLFAVYSLLSTFDATDMFPNIQFLLPDTCRHLMSEQVAAMSHCQHFLREILRGLSSHRYVTLNRGASAIMRELGKREYRKVDLAPEDSTPEAAAAAAAAAETYQHLQPAEDQLVCFPHLFVGSGSWNHEESIGTSALWRNFRADYLRTFGLNPSYTPAKQRISMVKKVGQRALHNLDETFMHLHSAFPTIGVDLISLKSLGSWAAEVEYLRDTTVLITTSGAIGMSGLFLPPGAAVIVIDTFDLNKETNVGGEEGFWSNVGHVQVFHYPFALLEVQLAPHLDRNSAADIREFGNVKINLERMTMLVTSALKHVANFMRMKD